MENKTNFKEELREARNTANRLRTAIIKIDTHINQSTMTVIESTRLLAYWKTIKDELGNVDTLTHAEDDKADEKIILDVEIRPSYSMDFITENIKFLNDLKSNIDKDNKNAV